MNYKPDAYQKNVFSINYDKLKKEKIKYLLFDLDNTLIPFHQKTMDKKVEKLFQDLNKEFKIIIFSNSPKKRLTRFNYLKVDIFYDARKPFKYGYKKFLQKYKCYNNQIVIIGDQLLTDIKLGKKVGIKTILLDPITKKEFCLTKINRLIENNKLKNIKQFEKGKYYD